ncbi:MAG: hypothetical protein AAF721_17895 [Myxococcota bacterium]
MLSSRGSLMNIFASPLPQPQLEALLSFIQIVWALSESAQFG